MNPVNPKVTAATTALAAVAFIIALIEWLLNVDVPGAVEAPLAIIATFAAGWLKSDANTPGDHEA